MTFQELLNQYVTTEENTDIIKAAITREIKEEIGATTEEVTILPTQTQVIKKAISENSGYVVLGSMALIVGGIVWAIRRKKA